MSKRRIFGVGVVAARLLRPRVDEVRLEEIAVWLKRCKVEAREERAQGRQEIAGVDYDSDLDFADSKAHGPGARELQTTGMVVGVDGWEAC